MPEVVVKEYLDEIERLIDESHVAEAISHCRHLIRQFPRFIEAYRLLGKALLENGELQAAADVFQRVLSADPEDFIAHAGLAIVRKQQNQLADAAWHMERAFEVEPYNIAVRESLQDLVGRRDGLPPEEISLTRAALARLYVRGELYSQAIGDLRQSLREQPERIDLHVLLAEAMWRDGQRIDAAEECAHILEQIPECIKANAILAEVYLETDRIEEGQAYLRRVFELTLPTASVIEEDNVVGRAFATEASPSLPEKIMVARAGAVAVTESAADWVNDLDFGDEFGVDNAEPQWLDAMQDDFATGSADAIEVQPTGESEETLEAGSESPEGTSWFSRSSDQLPGIGEVNQETDWESWLEREKESDTPVEQASQAISADVEEAEMGAMDEQGNNQEEFPESGGPQRSTEGESGAEEHGLDWLDELQEASKMDQDSSLPALGEDDLPDWLREEMEVGDAATEELEWLEEDGDSAEGKAAVSEELPDWLREDMEIEDDDSASGDELSWLDQIAAGEGAPLAEPPTMSWPETDANESPDVTEGEQPDETFLSDSALSDEWEPAMPDSGWDTQGPGEAEPAEMSDDDVPEDLEEAMAWLEQLAAQQGAPLDELPSLSSETASDEATEQVPAEMDDAMDWLDELARAEDEGFEPLGFASLEDSPESEFSGDDDWQEGEGEEVGVGEPYAELEDMALETGIGRTEFEAEDVEVEGEPLSDAPEDLDEAMAWLEELAAQQGAPLDELPSLQHSPDAETDFDIFAGDDAGVVDAEQDEAMAWLEELAGGDSDEELFERVDMSDRSDLQPLDDLGDIPEDPERALAWLEGLAEADDSFEISFDVEESGEAPVVQEEATPPVPHDVVAARAEAEAILLHEEVVGVDDASDSEMLEDIPDDPDEAMAWLERLAARQGAPLDELPSISGTDFSEEEPIAETAHWTAESEQDTARELDAMQWDLEEAAEEPDVFASAEDTEYEAVEATDGRAEEGVVEDEGSSEPTEVALTGELEDEDDIFAEDALADEDDLLDEDDLFASLTLEDDIEEGLPDWLAIGSEDEEELLDWDESARETTDWLDAEIGFAEDEVPAPDVVPERDLGVTEEIEAAGDLDLVEEELPTGDYVGAISTVEEEVVVEAEELVIPGEQEEVIEPLGADEDVVEDMPADVGVPQAANLEQARIALEEGRSEEALQTYQTLVERGGDLSTLIADLEQASESMKDQPAFVQLLGDAYNQNGQLQKALDAYRRALNML